MSKLFDGLDWTVNQIIKPLLALSGLAIALLIFIGVVSRSVFKHPLFGLEELVLLVVIWIYMLGAVLASQQRDHLTADFVSLFIKSQTSLRMIRLLASFLSMLIMLAILYWAYLLAEWSFLHQQTTPVFQLPWMISQVSPVVCSLLMTCYALRDFLADFAALSNRGNI